MGSRSVSLQSETFYLPWTERRKGSLTLNFSSKHKLLSSEVSFFFCIFILRMHFSEALFTKPTDGVIKPINFIFVLKTQPRDGKEPLKKLEGFYDRISEHRLSKVNI